MSNNLDLYGVLLTAALRIKQVLADKKVTAGEAVDILRDLVEENNLRDVVLFDQSEEDAG